MAGLTPEKIEYYRRKLEEHKKEVEKELERVGRRNPLVPGDWEPTPPDMNAMKSDANEMSDTFEEMESRAALEDNLEEHLTFINLALKRIEEGTYGICETCKRPISEARLEAYPMAKNCVRHAEGK